jgi:RNA polymerase sigma-70 factor (ECF subfamily)
MSFEFAPSLSVPPAEADAWQELSALVRQHRAELVAVARRQGMRPEEALECVQDALYTWLVQRRREPSAALHGLQTLKHIVKNAARNGRRRHHRLRPHLALDQVAELSHPSADAEQLVNEAETRLRLQLCVAQLREVERAVVSLRLLEERSGEDVAGLLGLSRAHVDVLVHRAKATLRVCMGSTRCDNDRVA